MKHGSAVRSAARLLAVMQMLAAACVPAFAAPADSSTPNDATRRHVDLLEALSLADRQSLEGRRAAAGSRIAAGEAGEARLAFIPELAATAGIGRTDGQVQGSFGDFRDVDFHTAAPFGRLALGVNPAEAWFGATAAGRRAAGAGSHEASVRRRVLVRVAERYYDLLERKAAVGVARLAVRDFGDLLRISEVLLRQGMGRSDDAERARTELANAEQRLIEAERLFGRASIDLALALDLDPAIVLDPREETVQEITLVAPQTDPGSLTDRALAARPEIAAARQGLEAVRSDRAGDIARLAAPRVEAFYEDGATGERYNDLTELRRYGVSATWTLSIGGLRHVGTSRVRSEDAALTLRQAEQQVRAEVAAALVDVRAAAARTTQARAAREAAEAALRIGQVRFRNGTALAIEVLQAEQALDQSRLSEVAALADYNRAQVRLRSQAGPLAPSDLAVPPGAPEGPAAPAASGMGE